MAAVRLSVRPLFPSPCGQPVGGSPGACVSPPLRAVLAGAASRRRNAAAAGRGSRPSGFPETSGRAAVSRPVCTALRRQGRVVARADRRPRLRHEARRRGGASAVSRPPQARARTDGSVHQSAQRSADRSGQPRSHGRCAAGLPPPCAGVGSQATFWLPVGSATRSNSRCALPPLAAPRGLKKEGAGAAALCPCHCFLPPRNPLQGVLRIAYRSWRSAAVPLLPLVLSGLFSLLASVWNVLPPGFCVKARPRCAHQQDGYRSLAASTGRGGRPGEPWCWQTAVAGMARAGDGRRTPVPDEVRAWACGPRGGNVPPHPSPVAALPG